MEIITRFFQDTKQSFFLFGPSTWVHKNLKNALFIDLLAPEVFRAYSAKPERLREVSEAYKSGGTIVIDEIQKIPELLDVVHQLMEQHYGWRFVLTGSSARKLKRWRFVLTGSSARKLKRSGVDLLAGRAVVKTMHPFMAAELGDLFSLEEALTIGLVPLVLDAPSPKEAISAYVALYLKEEVQMEGLVIHQLFPWGCFKYL